MSDVTPFSNIAALLIGCTHLLYAPFDVQSQLKFQNLEMVKRTILPKAAGSAEDASFEVVELMEGFFECVDGLIVVEETLCQKNEFCDCAEGTEHVIG